MNDLIEEDTALLVPRDLPEKQLLERDVEGPVKKYAKNRHSMLVDKFVSPSKRSVPDDLFTNNHGYMFFIEFKAPGEEPTEKQSLDHKKRRAKGVSVFVIDDIEEGKRLIDRMAKETPCERPFDEC